MKNKGTICKIDRLGRVVIPKKYREVLALQEGSKIEFLLLEDAILLRPCYIGICPICNCSIDLSKNYCATCGRKIHEEEKHIDSKA